MKIFNLEDTPTFEACLEEFGLSDRAMSHEEMMDVFGMDKWLIDLFDRMAEMQLDQARKRLQGGDRDDDA